MDFHGDYQAVYRLTGDKLLNSGSCHDFDHTLRVMKNAEMLLTYHPDADREIVMLAALLHDIARPEEDASKGKRCHAMLAYEMVPGILKDAGFPEHIARKVALAVKTHRFRGKNEPESLEADLVFDADKLDSLGAVGIGRAFLFAGHENARLHNTQSEALNSPAYSREDTAYREFLVKLRYLPRRMRSAAGRKIAVERAAFMTAFFEQLNLETGIAESNIQPEE
ncbi:MAG: HD domain-containing protein [Lentisphaeria bacterium]|nr:HD domain-containing protein [Lentisphaeria bacterium]